MRVSRLIGVALPVAHGRGNHRLVRVTSEARGRNINAEVDKLLAAQSRELDKDKRRDIVWQTAVNCWQPYVKGFRPHDTASTQSAMGGRVAG